MRDERLESSRSAEDQRHKNGSSKTVPFVVSVAKFIAYVLTYLIRLALPQGSTPGPSQLVEWLKERLPGEEVTMHQEMALWKNGALLCSLVNSVVPEACLNPHCHFGHPPEHGQALAYKYLGIKPVFTESDFNQKTLTEEQKAKFKKYLKKIRKQIISFTESIQNMKYCTDYVAKGMGLVACEQNRKATFFLYPIPKDYPLQDIAVYIKGPYSTVGSIVVPAIVKKASPSLSNYQRSLYLSGKLSSISPTLQGSTFLRNLSKNYGGEIENDIKIKIKVTKTNAKVSYVPKTSGIHDISLTTNGNHLIGSPFSVVVEPPTNKSFSDDSLSETEIEYKEVSRKYIPAVVDVNGEKMFLKEDGTLEKIKPEPTQRILKPKNPTDKNSNNFEIQNKNIQKGSSDWQNNWDASNKPQRPPKDGEKPLEVKSLFRIEKGTFVLEEKDPQTFVDNMVHSWNDMDLNSNLEATERTNRTTDVCKMGEKNIFGKEEGTLDGHQDGLLLEKKIPKAFVDNWVNVWNDMDLNSNRSSPGNNPGRFPHDPTAKACRKSEIGNDFNQNWNSKEGRFQVHKNFVDNWVDIGIEMDLDSSQIDLRNNEGNLVRSSSTGNEFDKNWNSKSLVEKVPIDPFSCGDGSFPSPNPTSEVHKKNCNETDPFYHGDNLHVPGNIPNETEDDLWDELFQDTDETKILEQRFEDILNENHVSLEETEIPDGFESSDTIFGEEIEVFDTSVKEVRHDNSWSHNNYQLVSNDQISQTSQENQLKFSLEENESTLELPNDEISGYRISKSSSEEEFESLEKSIHATDGNICSKNMSDLEWQKKGISGETFHNPAFPNSSNEDLQTISQIPFPNSEAIVPNEIPTSLEKKFLTSSFEILTTNFEDLRTAEENIQKQFPLQIMDQISILRNNGSLLQLREKNPDKNDLEKNTSKEPDVSEEHIGSFQIETSDLYPGKRSSELIQTKTPTSIRTEIEMPPNGFQVKDALGYEETPLEPNFSSGTNYGGSIMESYLENQIQVLENRDQQHTIKLFDIQDDQGTKINILEETGKILTTELNPKLEDTEVFLDCLENELPPDPNLNQNLSSPVTPDILEVPICESQSFVQEETFDFEYVRKTFSKKDPSYDSVENKKMEAFKPTKKIISIVNLFESKSQSNQMVDGYKMVTGNKMADGTKRSEGIKKSDGTKSLNRTEFVYVDNILEKSQMVDDSEIKMDRTPLMDRSKMDDDFKMAPQFNMVENSPDLVKCHSSNSKYSKFQKLVPENLYTKNLKNYKLLNKKWKNWGVSYKSFDKNQRFLKCLVIHDLKNIKPSSAELPVGAKVLNFEKVCEETTQALDKRITPFQENGSIPNEFSYQISNLTRPSFPVRKIDRSRLKFDSTESKIPKIEPKIIETREGIVDYKIKELTSRSQENLQKDIPIDLKFLPGGLVKNKLKIFETGVSKNEIRPSLPRKSNEKSKIIERDTNLDIDEKIVSIPKKSCPKSFDEKFSTLKIEVFKKENESKVLERTDNKVADSSKTNDIPKKKMLNKEIKIKEKQKQRFEKAKNFFKTLEKSRDEVVESSHSDEDCDNPN